VTEAPEKYVGGGVPRKEDPALVTGRANWTDNIKLPGMLHMAVLRSPFAHAKITHLDVSGALEQPGVTAAYTGEDLAPYWNAPMPCAWPVTEDIKIPDHWPLARGEVNFMGDAVAVVIADDRYTAQDALEFIEVDYEPLEAVVDMEEALEEDASLVHEDLESNQSFLWPLEVGDIDGAFERADVVVKERYIQQRLIPNAIEPRAVVANPEPTSDGITLYTATQVPHIVRLMLSAGTGIPEQRVRVVAPDVGGGFGSKLNFYAEELLATNIARLLGTPIKWVEDRSENYMATIHGRDQIQDIEVAATSEGKILAVRADIKADMGAYMQLVTPGIPILGAFMYCGVYQFDAYAFYCTGVFTNKTPTDAYRGAGRPEAAYAIERIVEALARELDMDPVEVRRKNFYEPFDEPTTTPAGIQYDSLNLPMVLDRVLELADYEGLREEQRRRREENDPVQLGIGFSTYTEICGLAPSQVLASLRYGAPGWESATVRMFSSGKVEVVTGTSPHGQGHVTSWSQIAADALGVTPDDVEVLHGDTATSPHGLDTYGSRSLPVGGVAVHLAAQKVADKARKIAAHMIEASEDDLEFEGGRFSVTGSPDQNVTIQDVAAAAFAGTNLPEDMEPGLTADTFYDPPNFVFPFGTHVAVVEVDEETGAVELLDYAAVDDCGIQVNPMIVEGQLHGGIVQGAAQALWEEAIYDDDGNLRNPSLVDYCVPTAAEVPSFKLDHTVTPSPTNALGVKGIGEAGTIVSTPTVINAIVDALAPLGITDMPMPATPERVWAAIRTARAAEGAR
jgi:carbon-monoxide dehydrogenase large subunit